MPTALHLIRNSECCCHGFTLMAITFALMLFVGTETKAQDDLFQTDVFVAGEEGYHTYRIPSIITAFNGDLLAICEGRKDNRGDHGNIDLIMKRSSDGGKSWGDIEMIYEEGGDEKITIGNPCPVVASDTGTIWMTFCKNNDEVFVVSSRNNGVNWSKPKSITKDVKGKNWGWYATGPGVGIQLNSEKYNGRLVIPCDHREKRDGKWVKMSHVFYSDDRGNNWKLGGTVADHTDECQVVEMSDGRLMINMRNYWAREGGAPGRGGKRAVSISEDGGETWKNLTFDDALIEPVCQASIHRHFTTPGSDPVYLFSNPASKSARKGMTIRLSRDEGTTWPVSKVLHQGPAAYSCLTSLPGGSVGCLYERGDSHAYEKLTFARFKVGWLEK